MLSRRLARRSRIRASAYETDESQSGVCTVTMIHDVAGAPMVAGMVPGGGDPSKGGGGWPWVA